MLGPHTTCCGRTSNSLPRADGHSQGLLRSFKNRPRRQRGSTPTLSTLQVARIGQPGLAAGTLRTSEALPPPNPLQKRQTRRFRREPLVELLQGSGIVNAANRMRPGLLRHPEILHLVAGPSKWIPPFRVFRRDARPRRRLARVREGRNLQRTDRVPAVEGAARPSDCGTQRS